MLFVSSVYTLSLFASNADDAKSLVGDGAKLCNEKGLEVCLKSFNDKKGSYVRGSLYLFAINYEGETLAHGGNPRIVGKNLSDLKSPDGVFIFREFIKIAKEKKQGWINYTWSHPQTKKIAAKTTFIKAIGNSVLIGSGFYK